jgi:hypothetical protein
MSKAVSLSESTLVTEAGAVTLLGLNGKAPTQAGAITTPAQTSAAVVTTGVTQTTPFGYAGATQGNAVATTINAIVVDIAALKVAVDAIRVALTNAGITA